MLRKVLLVLGFSLFAFLNVFSATFFSQNTGDFSNLSNWNTDPAGTGSAPIATDLTDGTNIFIIQDGHVITLDQDIDVAGLTVGQGVSGTLTLGNDATARTIVIQGDLLVNSDGILNVAIFNATHTLNLQGNITNNGTLDLYNDITQSAATTISNTISISGTNVPQFGSLTISSGTTSALVSLDVEATLTLETATIFDDGGLTHTVAGNWTENGSGQRTGAGTINFDSPFTQQVTAAATFNNVIFSGDGIVTLAGSITVQGDWTINNNTQVVTNVNQTISGNFTIEIGSEYSASGGTTIFNGSATQNIDLSGTNSFDNVNFDNGGAGNPKVISGNFVATDRTIIFDDAVVNDFGGDHTLEQLLLDGQLNFSGTITFTGNAITSNINNTLTLGTADIIVLGGTVSLNGDDNVIINGDLTIQTGQLNVDENASITGTPGGTLTIFAGRTIRLRGADNFPTGFGGYVFQGTNSRALYDLNGPQVVRGGIAYGELELGGGGTKTADGGLDIEGDLDLNNGVTLDLGAFNHTLGDDLLNNTNSSITSTGGAFAFDGTSTDQIMETAGTGSYLFINFTVDNTANPADRNFSLRGAITTQNFNAVSPTTNLIVDINDNVVFGDFTGTFSLGTNVSLFVQGASNFSTTGVLFAAFSLDVNSIVRFDGADQNLPGIPYGNIELTSSGVKTAQGAMDISGDITRIGGTPSFNDGGFTHTIAGNWNLTENFTPAGSQTGTIIFDGSNQSTNGSNFNNVVFSGTGTKTLNGDIDLSGNLTIENGVTVDANIRDIDIEGNWDDSGTGTFTQTTGFVLFDGTAANQTLSSNPNSSFAELIIDKTNASFETLTSLTDFSVDRDLELDENSATFDLNGQTAFIGRDWQMELGTTFNANGGTLHFNGDIQQDIFNFVAGTQYFNIILSGAGEKNVGQNALDINGSVTINGAIFDSNNLDMTVAGDWTNTGSFEHNRLVTFDGVNQNIGSSTFHDVATSGSGTKLLTGNITLGDDLTIGVGTTLDVGVANNSITLEGDWINNGTFVERNGSVTMNGGGSDIFSGASGPSVGNRFYNLTVNSTGTKELNGDLDVEGDLNILAGELESDGFDLYLAGSFVNSGTFDHNNNNSLLTFDATSGSHDFTPGGSTIRNIAFTAPGATYTLGSDLTQQTANNRFIQLDNGTFETNSFDITNVGNFGDIQINGGTFNVQAGSIITLGREATINNDGGIFMLVGDGTSPATLTSNQTNNDRMITVIQTAGTFHARNYLIERVRVNGVDIQGGSIDATNNFSDGTFTNGSTTGNAYLTLTGLDLGAGVTIDNVIFNSGPTFNVSRTSGNGSVTFTNSSGTLNGEANDEDNGDPGTLILFTFPGGFFWDGGGDGISWNDQLNWSSDLVPTSSNNVTLDHTFVTATYSVNITGIDASTSRLTLEAAGGNDISLILNGQNLTVNENIQIGASTTVTQTNPTDIISVVGNWTNEGTFNEGTSTVRFIGTSGTNQITTRGSSDPFYNLEFNSPGATYTLQNDTDIDNDFLLEDGILAVNGNLDINVGGDWTVNGGTFSPTSGRVIFDQGGTGTQIISGGTFFDFETDNSTGSGISTKQITGSIIVGDDIRIRANTILDGGSGVHRITDDWTNDVGVTGFIQSSGGTVIFEGGNQSINGSPTNFQNLFFQGANTKTVNTDISVDGSINIAAVTVDLVDGITVTGNGSANSLNQSAGTLRVRGADPNPTNFPTGFETINLSGGVVEYRANSAQNIFPTTYFDLNVRRTDAGNLQTKTLTGDITILDDLIINDVETELDVAGFTITLADDIPFPAGGRQIAWNGGTLIHNGTNDFNIDPDITGFNNLILTGSGGKFMNGNLTITGDVTVQSGIRLEMNDHTMTSDGSGSFTLTANARLDSDIPASTGPAFPTNFATYSLDQTSRTILRGNSDKTIYTNGGTISYGELNMAFDGTVTPDGNLDVDGDFLIQDNDLTLQDGGFDMNLSGDNIDIRVYTATTNTVTFDGGDQTIQFLNGDTNPDVITLNNVIFTGSGSKPFTSGDDLLIVNGDFTIESNVIMTANIDFQIRGNWTNNGSFTHTTGFFTFDGTGNQIIDPGVNHTFDAITFSNGGANAKTVINNGFDINDDLTIDAGTTVDFGSLTHNIAAPTIINNGTWNTSNSNLIFDRNNAQSIPAITALDVQLTEGGTKTMQGDWSVDDLTIASGVTLDANNTGDHNITLTGNWDNNGTFNDREGTVAFESNDTNAKTIKTNGSNFFNVTFNQAQTNSRTYTLTENTEIDENLTIGNGAFVDVNSNILTLGNNDNPNVAEVHTIQTGGTLEIDESASLLFECSDGNSQLIVEGTFRVVGTASNNALVSRSGGGNRIDIDITTGTIAAQFYEFRFLVDEGLDIQSAATIDPINNLSDGSWSEINTSAAATRRYLIIEADVTGLPDINNVVFNHGTSPTLGVHFNVQRSASAVGTVTFDGTIGGLMGSEIYEDDGDGTKINWPPATIATWTGAINSDWHTAGNWSPMTVPNNLIQAIIPTAANQPVISLADATCQTLTITDGNLVVTSGFDLTIITDVTIGTGNSFGVLFVGDPTSEITLGGGWSTGNNGQFSPNTGEVTFTAATGAVNITPRSNAFHDMVFSGAATFNVIGDMDVNGSITITSGTLAPSTNNYNITVAGDINNVGGTLSTVTNGTFELDGTDQQITNMPFDNLVIGGTGTKTMNGTVNINDDLTVNSTMAGATGSLIEMDGDVLINSGALFDDGGENHTFSGGDWTGIGGYSGAGTVTFDGGDQDINGGFFNNIDFAGTGRVDIFGDVDVTGDVIARNTINTLRSETFLINNTSGTGTFTLEAGEQLYILGANNFPSNFATYNLDATSEVRYEGVVDQSIASVTYGTLRLNNANTKTLLGNIEVQSDIDINTSTLDVSTNNFRITLGDDFDNNDGTGGQFIARQGELVLNGTSTTDVQQLQLGPSGSNDFFRLTVNKPTGAAEVNVANNNLFVNENLRVNSGIFDLNGFTATVSGDLTASSGTFTTSGLYILNQVSGSANLQMNGSILLNVEINSGATYSLLDDFALNGNFTLTSGTFNTNGQTATLGNGADVVSISGTYIVGPDGTMALGNGTNVVVNSGGEIQAVGTATDIATITSAGTGDFNFTVNGTIQAQNYLFNGVNVNGIVVSASGTIDGTNNFSNGTFTDGDGGGTFLRVENTQDFTGINSIDNVSFPSNPGGGAFNVTKSSSSSGTLEFTNSSGAFSGEDFDNDPNNLINWTGVSVITWDGSESTDWFDPNNWTPAQVPTATDNVQIPAATNVAIINSSGAVTAALEIDGGFLQINTADAGVDLAINGELTLDGVLTMNSANDRLEIQGNWTRIGGGSFIAGVGSTVAFTSVSGFQSVNNGASPFYNVEVNSGGTVQILSNTDVNNDFSIIAGEFDVSFSDFTLTIGGSFSNAGTFTPQDGLVLFDSNSGGIESIDMGSSAFNDVEINGNPSTTFQMINTNLTVNGDLDIANGTFDLNGLTLNMGSGANISVNDLIDVGANSTLNLGSNAAVTVNTGGVFRVVGSDASNVATITGSSSGRYSFIVSSGGELEARFYLFQFMNSTGIQLAAGAIIDGTNNLSDGTFSNGDPSGRYLFLQNSFSDFTASNVVYNSGAAVNARRVSGTGIITFEDASGLVSGPDFEDDSPDGDATTGFIRWDFTNPVLTWTGGGMDNDWHNANNWDDGMGGNSVPISITNVFIPVTAFDPVISNADAVAGIVNISAGATLTVNTDRNLTMSTDFNNAGTFTVSGGSNSIIEVGGTWSNAGTFNNGGNSTVRLTADSGNETIQTGGSAFCGLEINSATPGTATFSTLDPIDVDCNFTINAGTLTISNVSHTLNVGGNWSVSASGTFNNGGSSVTFDGTTVQNLTQTSGDSFNDLNISGSGSVALLSGIDVNGNLSISSALDGGAGNTLSVFGNWVNTGTFTIGSSTVVLDGSSQQQVSSSGGEEFFSLTVNNTSSSFPQVIINDGATINTGGTLTLTDGVVETSSSALLVMNDNTFLSGGSTSASYITGPMVKDGQQDFTFPIGRGNVFARIRVSGMTNTATLRAEYFDADFGNATAEPSIVRVSRVEYWDLTRTSGTGQPFVTLFWEDGNRSLITNPSTLVVGHFETSEWLNIGNGGTTGNATTGSITSAFSVDNFSPFTLASTDDSNPLPVSLTSFEGETINGENHLIWQTATEINNDFFELQRSFDGVNYEVIATIDGNGTKEEISNYSFVDKLPFVGNNFYRLKQVDFDGAFEILDQIVLLNIEPRGDFGISIYPNPTTTLNLNTRIEGNQHTPIVIKMIDLYGKEVYKDVITLDAVTGDYKFRFTESMKQGIYVITIQQGDRSQQSKVILTD